MTQVLFAHDHRFVTSGTEVFSEGQFKSSSWDRYLSAFDSVAVVSRSRPKKAGELLRHLNRCNSSRVSFTFVANIASLQGQVLHRKQVLEALVKSVENSDAVIARLPSELGLAAAKIAVRLRKPWAVEVVGSARETYWNHGGWIARPYAFIADWRTRQTVKIAPFVLYVTKEFLQRRYPSEGVAGVCSNVQMERPDASVLQARMLRIESTALPWSLGFIGSLQVKYKGLQTLLDVLAQLKEKLPPFVLKLLGPGETSFWLKRVRRLGLDRNVKFEGVLQSGSRIWQWLDEVDLYLQPSLSEGLPRSVIEAMSRGCPVIASTAGGIPELLAEHCLHQPGVSSQLESLILRASKDVKWEKEQARRNFQVALEYSSDILEPRREQFYKKFERETRSFSPE